MKSILILGATGYIGRNLTLNLLKSFNVISIKFGSHKIDEYILKHKKFVCYKYKNSYTDLKIFIKKYKPFLMINCAGKYINSNNGSQIDELINGNLSNITNVIDAAVNSGCKKIINTGTIWQFQNNIKKPFNFYATTKETLEVVLKFYQDQYNLKIINLYITDTYGPKDERKKLISIIESSIKKNDQIILSNKKKILDYLHIEDLVELYLKLIKKINVLKRTDILYRYFPRGERLSLKEIIGIIEKKNITLNYKWSNLSKVRKFDILNPSIIESNFKINWKIKKSLSDYFDRL